MPDDSTSPQSYSEPSGVNTRAGSAVQEFAWAAVNCERGAAFAS